MKCKNCGTELLDSDIFCVKCGKKVVEDNICPKCGEQLRDGTKFCSKCGCDVTGNDDDIPVTSEMPTKDIPFDLIEKNIIFEATQQVQSREYKETGESNITYSANNQVNHSYSSEENEDYYDEYYDENEDYYEEEDFEDYEEDKSSRVISIIMIIAGIIIVLGIAAIFFNYRNKSYKPEIDNYEIEEQQNINDMKTVGTIIIIDNVNIRDNPNTNNSNILGVAKKDEKYEYYGYSQDMNWYHIKIDDSTDGYVYKEYVEELSQ